MTVYKEVHSSVRLPPPISNVMALCVCCVHFTGPNWAYIKPALCVMTQMIIFKDFL